MLDLILPYLSGFDLLKAVREARSTLPVIILTASGEEADRVVEEVVELPAFLPEFGEPVEGARLLEVVEALDVDLFLGIHGGIIPQAPRS